MNTASFLGESHPTMLGPSAEGISIDFISPQALKISLANLDGHDVADDNIEVFTGEELERAVAYLLQASTTNEEGRPMVFAVVAAFTKVFILRKDPTDLNSFGSASSGQFVGRSLIVNATGTFFQCAPVGCHCA